MRSQLGGDGRRGAPELGVVGVDPHLRPGGHLELAKLEQLAQALLLVLGENSTGEHSLDDVRAASSRMHRQLEIRILRSLVAHGHLRTDRGCVRKNERHAGAAAPDVPGQLVGERSRLGDVLHILRKGAKRLVLRGLAGGDGFAEESDRGGLQEDLSIQTSERDGMRLPGLDDPDGGVDSRWQVQRLREVVEGAHGEDAERVPGIHQLPHDPTNASIAARDDDQGGGSDQLFDLHLGIELDDEAPVEGFAQLGFDLGCHRSCLGAQDQQALRPPRPVFHRRGACGDRGQAA